MSREMETEVDGQGKLVHVPVTGIVAEHVIVCDVHVAASVFENSAFVGGRGLPKDLINHAQLHGNA